MTFRYFYTRILIYTLLIVLFSVLGVLLFLKNYNFLFVVFDACLIILCITKILNSFDSMREKVTYFFNAVENEDSTLCFSETVTNKPLRELHKSLNRVNELIKEVKLKNREQEQYFSVLLEQVATGILVFNNRGDILQANNVAKELLNYETLTHIVQLKSVDKNLYEAFSVIKKTKRELVKLTNKNNVTQLILQATDFKARNSNFTIVAIQDIRNELEAKEVESWIKMIRVLTHEIMNSITPITSLSDTLISYYKQPNTEISESLIANTVKGLEVIKERGVGLTQFVNSYRQLTKISAPNFKTIDLKSFIEHIVLLVSNETDKNIYFEQNITPENLILQADEGQLSQVLINLIKNALQAVADVSQPSVKISASQKKDKNIIITVEDNGMGISQEVMEQIFVPFFTTKDNGSGIGLSISRQIMRNHGGTINVISKTNEGSKFMLEF